MQQPTLHNSTQDHLHQTFKTNDLNPIQSYPCFQFDRDSSSLRMHQVKYALSILRQFNMKHCAPSQTPLPEGMILLPKYIATPHVDATIYRMLVGKTLFLIKTQPDIIQDVNVVSRFMPSGKHTCKLQNISCITCAGI